MAIVATEAGTIKGAQAHGVHAFLGVPYAAPVTAANRFEAPEPALGWTGVRPATRLGSVCPQLPTYGPVGTNATSALAQGEDFRTLNIRTRDLAARAPVLVWIHGGGYAVGSANEPILQSGAFAASGIVEITVNYRLGALGFLRIPGMADNRGLLDLIVALRWIARNIEAFGGDPTRVTLAGRSAGGFAVAALMAVPDARGLFHRALPQSGASTGIATPDDAEKLAARMTKRLGGPLREAALADLLLVQRDLCNESYEHHDFARDGQAAMLGVPFVPVIDGVSLPAHPEIAAAEGRTAPVPMLTGCTSAEYLTHSSILPDALDEAGVARLVHERVRPVGWTGRAIVERYRAALPGHSPHGLWRAICGDLVFQNPATRFALHHSGHQRVLKYVYGSIGADETGAAHGAEVGAVWYRRGMDPAEQPARQRIADIGFAARVHEVWRSFIAGEEDADAWPLFDGESACVLHLTQEGEAIVRDPFFERCDLWRDSPNEAAR